MKMRFWQKTYLFTLALFLICLNVGVLSLTVYTYQKNVSATETAVTAEQAYVALSFERDYEDMTESNSFSSPSLLMQTFGNYYGEKGLYLAFEESGDVVYSNFKYDYEIGKNTLLHRDFDEQRHVLVSSEICNGRYDMIFAKNVEFLDVEFRSLMVIYLLTAIGVSLILAIGLYFVLKKLSAPLERLRKTTEVVEAGNFSVTAEETGTDEFTLLAKSFNAMLGKINEQMIDLEQEAERKQMLVDNMAHETRTPLTSIHGYAEFIEKANASEERKLIASKYIMSEAERLQKISEILLDDAFIRGNEIEMTEINLGLLLSDVADKLQIRAEKSSVEISCRVSSVTVQGNETLLSMLFYNLAENAVKACSIGGKVQLSCGDGWASVEDDGKGMSEEQLLHITEPFYRTDKSRSRAEGGAGLGLALCKRIVQTHGAEMHFESEPERGTKITVTFTSRQ
ncbi:MAG: HAMP domain-containing histidine kinase [Clostridia bacterium]|nr:HAMP domain-containing histidine kinase [Clostridia bacterium]